MDGPTKRWKSSVVTAPTTSPPAETSPPTRAQDSPGSIAKVQGKRMTQSPNQSTWNVPQQNAQDSGCNYTGWAKTGASVLGGLGIGALLMYLFDPEEGQQRRGYLTEAASDLASR